jgi:multisubunit Na+/H+ antiporter MnhG subunit
MGLDIRIPIGLMFAIMGALLTVFGAVGNKEIYARSLGVNVNLLWGVVLLVVGIGLFVLGKRQRGSSVR